MVAYTWANVKALYQQESIETLSKDFFRSIISGYPSGSRRHFARLSILRKSTAHASELLTLTNCGKMAMKADIIFGDKFSSENKLEAKIASYQNKNFVQLTRQDSRTLDHALKRHPKRMERANPALLYYTIHFACVIGGKGYKNEGTGQGLQQLTIKQSCKAGIKEILRDDAQSLVTEVVQDHNYEVDKGVLVSRPKRPSGLWTIGSMSCTTLGTRNFYLINQ
uniref:ZSWIM3 N-terminal domain-containing protein n=1 Tax=Amphimedon queenslandica TaxID=400682 RepID=A0A1X7UT13_AMPQE